MKKSKKKLKKPLPSILRVVGIVIVIIIGINTINAQSLVKSSKKAAKKHNKVANTVQKIEIAPAYYEEPVVEEVQENNNEMENIVETNEESNNEIQSIVDTSYTTRMTSFYPEEGEIRTGSGLEPKDFEINEYGWFTYQGKLVVAAATVYLANQGWYIADGVHLYKYYDEITLNIDGVDYPAIVLDSCGSSTKTDRIDLYVSSVIYAKDTQIIVKE